MIRVLFLSLLIAACQIATAARAAENGPPKKELVTEVLRTRDELNAFINNLEITYKETSQTRLPGGKEDTLVRQGRYRLAGNFRAIETYSDDKTRKSIRAYNSKYAFFMGRSKGRSNDELFQYDPSVSENARIVEEVDIKVNRFLGASQTLMYYYSLVDILEGKTKEDFTLISIQTVRQADRELVKVQFERLEAGVRYPCWAFLDPKNHWAVVEAVVQCSWGKSTQTVQYNPEITDAPFPKRVLYITDAPQKQVFERMELLYGTPRACTATEEDFTLPAYGLPEPSRRTPFIRYVFLLANVVLVVGLVILFLLRRRKEQSRE